MSVLSSPSSKSSPSELDPPLSELSLLSSDELAELVDEKLLENDADPSQGATLPDPDDIQEDSLLELLDDSVLSLLPLD